VRSGRRNIALALFGAGLALVLVAVVSNDNTLDGSAEILIGLAVGMYALQGAPPHSRSPQLYIIGLAVASVGAILAGILTLGSQTAVAEGLTFVVIGGALLAAFAYGPARR